MRNRLRLLAVLAALAAAGACGRGAPDPTEARPGTPSYEVIDSTFGDGIQSDTTCRGGVLGSGGGKQGC